MSFLITRVASDADIRGVLALQQANLRKNLTAEQIASQGFVTVEHTYEVMAAMNQAEPSVIAKDGDKVVGYALVMLPAFRADLPILEGLFQQIDAIDYEGKPLGNYHYAVVGQLCVGDGYRGQGMVEQLYAHFQEVLKAAGYEMGITDISSKNPRSLKAHQKAGFKVVKSFFDEHAQEQWDIVVLDWRNN